MKKKQNRLLIAAFILLSGLIFSCQREENNDVVLDNEIEFGINISNPANTSLLKSAKAYSLSDAAKIILTIQNTDGSPTKYTSSEVKIFQMNGSYYTQKLVLKTGSYKLTEFVLIDTTGNTVFATPLTASVEAQNVNSPLPIAFNVSKNANSSIVVDVVSTEKKQPSDFGLTQFPFSQVKTFSFLIGVADKQSDRLIAARLTIKSGSYVFTQQLDSVLNNVVTVRDGLDNYLLTVEAEGFKTFTNTYSLELIKSFNDSTGNLPLLLELEKGGFFEDFNSSILDTSWHVYQFSGTRVNGYTSPANHYSLSEATGSLRYILDPMTSENGFMNNYNNIYINPYYYNPGLEISRNITGTKWTIETKVTYHLPYTNGRAFVLRIYFGDGGANTYYLDAWRDRDVHCNFLLFRYVHKFGSGENDFDGEPATGQEWDYSSNGPSDHVVWIRFDRDNGVLKSSYSFNGVDWTNAIITEDLGTSLNGLAQKITFTGSCWFNPEGSFADYDYIKFVQN